MNVKEARRLVKKISYKPEWTFSVNQNGTIMASALVVDANDRTSKVETFITVETADGDFAVMVSRIRLAILFIEHHEVDEWFRIDGIQVVNPHPDN